MHENVCMALRYCYYVLNVSVVSDETYDKLEKKALEVVSEDSPLRLPGSSLEGDYTDSQKLGANLLIQQMLREDEHTNP